ncbi:MAG: CotH kinase family protein [Chitinophagales bacterium]|nr:CotH kinase family protein [Chitinophagales bacterium]
MTLPHTILAALLLLTTTTQAQIRINELLAVNSGIAADPDFGEFADYVELYNESAAPVQLSGFSLSDDAAEPDKWPLPNVSLAPGQYLLIWADGLDKYPGDTAFVPFKNAVKTMTAPHAGFKLSADGEYIGLFGAQGDLVDELMYCTQANDVSFGRSPLNPGLWWYFSEPTPGAPNTNYGSPIMETPGEPSFSLAAGFYDTPQMLYLSTQEPGAQIHFTFDGSTPNAQSPVFSDSFPLNLNLCIKARLYVPGKMPGKVVTRSYFIQELLDLPVLSISSNASNLYGFDYGILQNAIKDREVPATMEYFEPGGSNRAFVSGVGLRIFGTTIFNLPQRPLSVRFKEKFGDEPLRYPLFKGKPITQYSAFLLRNGGNDYNTAYFRDGLAVNLVKGKMDIDYQDYQPCVVFINGAYQGIYELRERLDESYLASNHEINANQIDYLEDSLQVASGTPFAFAALMDFVRQNNLADSFAFAQVAEQVDVHEFCNYLINRAFIGYQIADLNNRYWRNRDTQGKWRWITADMEHAFGLLGGDPFTENTIGKLAGLSGNLPEWATLLFNRMLQNQGFRDEFIQRSAVYLNTIYQPEVTTTTLDSLKNVLQTQMPRHIGRWHTPPSMQAWQGNVEQIRTFLEKRPAYYRKHLTELFGKQDSAQVTMHLVGQGKVLVSGMAFTAGMSGPFFKQAAIRLEAIPAPGFRFVAWQGLSSTTPGAILIPAGDTVFTAVFESVGNFSIIPPVITTDTLLTAAASPWYGLEDVVIMPGARLTVEAGATLWLTDGICFNVQGGLLLNGTDNQRIVVEPDPAPSARRSFYGQTGFWGSLMTDGATDSMIIRYTDIRGGSFGRERSRHFSTISSYNSNLVVDHSTITGGKAPLIARGGTARLSHSEFHTYVSCNGFVSLYNMDAPLIEHCIFKGNRAINTDGIDLKGITNGIVRNNQVSGFLGDNCDGIDLGIYTLNNLLEYNVIHDCSDKGISIGSQSTALIRRNLIYDCDLGVAVKDSLAMAQIDQNTFYGNRNAVACYEKSALRGGGKAVVRNTILSASTETGISFDTKSEILVSYSLSDKELLPGTGNLLGDPAFVHPSTGNFALLPQSPAINSGDPFSAPDPDGSRADMGAYYTHTGAYGLLVHINEFQYHPPFNYDTGDWLEVSNRADTAISLQGWQIRHGLEQFVFDEQAAIAPGGFLVLCQDTALFHTFHAGVQAIAGNTHWGLDNKSGKIALYNPAGELMHSVRYTDAYPWPILADGQGATVELREGLDGNLPEDWQESQVLLGSPGAPNSQPQAIAGLFVNEILASNTHTLPDEQGEFDDWFELYNSTSDTLNIGGLCFTDDVAKPCKWQTPLHFPARTAIPPHGFLLLWADEQPGQGVLHAGFRLSAGGEMVAIFQRSTDGYEEIERLSFAQQNPDISWGRYPDGSTQTIFMAPTPGATNVMSDTETPLQADLAVYPNPFSKELYIQAENLEMPFVVTLYNMLGQVVYQSGNQWQENTRIRRSVWPAGVYTLELRDAGGRRLVKRVISDE